MQWNLIAAPSDVLPPSPLTMRVQTIPARHCFAAHRHAWNQVVYARSGVLMVAAEGQSFVISPDQAVWIPSGVMHGVGSFLGAEYRSLWLANDPGGSVSEHGVTVFGVSPLLKALIVEAAEISRYKEHSAKPSRQAGAADRDGLQGANHRNSRSYSEDLQRRRPPESADARGATGYAECPKDVDGYFGRVCQLVMDQLHRACPVPFALVWPTSTALLRLCETLYHNPADARSPDEWGQALGMSGRTLERRFRAETGLALRTWRRRLKLFRSIEFLENGFDVTRTALELGYGSPSAFVYAFRSEMRCSPLTYMRTRPMYHANGQRC